MKQMKYYFLCFIDFDVQYVLNHGSMALSITSIPREQRKGDDSILD